MSPKGMKNGVLNFKNKCLLRVIFCPYLNVSLVDLGLNFSPGCFQYCKLSRDVGIAETRIQRNLVRDLHRGTLKQDLNKKSKG